MMDPQAKSYVEGTLTWRSSHPQFARERARGMLRTGMLFLVFCLGVVLWQAARLDEAWFERLWRGQSIWALAAYLVLIGLAAFMATGVLIVRVSVSGWLPKEGGLARISPGAYAAALLGAATAGSVLFFLPQIAPPGSPAAAELRKLAVILAFLPYVATLVLLELLGPCQAQAAEGWRRNRGWFWLFLVGSSVCAIALGASLDPDRAARFAAWPPVRNLPVVGPWLAPQSGPPLQESLRILSATLLIPTLYVLAEWTLSGIPKPQLPPAPPPPAPAGWWRRFLVWLKRLFGDDTSTSPPRNGQGQPPSSLPPWLDALLKSQPAPPGIIRFNATPPTKAAKTGGACDLDSMGDYDSLFAGRRPSQDQRQALLHFIRSHSQLYQEDGLTNRHATADFFLEGPPATGKTGVLVACAVFAAVARGERVCLLVPNSPAVTDLLDRMRSTLAFSGLHWMIRCEALTGGTPVAMTQEPPLLPDILIGTPEGWERLIFGAAPGQETRRLALSVTTLLIDDLASPGWTPAQSLHLPFLLDKQRLLLASEQRRLQLVVAVRPLLQAARESLGGRLFATPEGAAVVPHSQRLRPWQTEWPWHISVVAAHAGQALTSSAGFCLRHGIRPLIFLEGAGDEVRREVTEVLRQTGRPDSAGPTSGDPPRFDVITHLRDVEPSAAGTWQAVFYQASDTRGLLPSLFARFGQSATIFLSIDTPSSGRESRAPDLGQDPTFPVLASQRSPALLATHLRSAAPLLASGVPFSRNVLSAHGFPVGDQLPRALGSYRSVDPQWPAFALDPPELKAPFEQDALPWPMTAPQIPETLLPQPVGFDDPLDPRLGCRLTHGGTLLQTGRLANASHEARLAHWIDPRGVHLGDTDLARLCDLRWRQDNVIYWASAIEVDHQGHCRFQASFWRGTGEEAHRPVFDLVIRPPARAHLEIIGPRFGGPDNLKSLDLRWHPLPNQPPEPGDPKRSENPPVAATALHAVAEITLQGAATARHRVDRYASPVVFRYPCAISLVLLDPNLPPEANLQDHLAALLDGEWATNRPTSERVFWPELTGGLNQAIHTIAPQLHDFSRIIAFRMPQPLGGAAVLFVEPLVTAGTAAQFINALHRDPDLPRLLASPAVDGLDIPGGRACVYASGQPLDPKAARTLLQTTLTAPPRSRTRSEYPADAAELHGLTPG